MGNKTKNIKKKSDMEKASMTRKTAEIKKRNIAREEKQVKKAKAQLLRRAAEGKVTWETKPSSKTGGPWGIRATGGSQKLIRAMIRDGKLRLNGKKVVVV